ncbi:MAG: hypothetical protein LBM87_05085 [Ruminococcus sp.]|nr:hypothetical protein [Ruminococcus sp.]
MIHIATAKTSVIKKIFIVFSLLGFCVINRFIAESTFNTPEKMPSFPEFTEIKPINVIIKEPDVFLSSPPKKAQPPVIHKIYTPPPEINEPESIPPGIALEIPELESDFKAFMSYKAITDKTAPQWEYRLNAYTDEHGLRRIEEDYLVAMGTYYASSVGERFRITLETGSIFTVMTGDIKDDAHTDPEKMYTPAKQDGKPCANVLEFIVDTDKLADEVLTLGTVSFYEHLKGNITKIERL